MKHPLFSGLIHVIGIGGIGMSAIAEVMAARGFSVQGSDQKDSANLRRLSAKGVRVFTNHDERNLANVSAVVISTAVKETNPELQAAKQIGLPVYSRAEALAALMEGYRTISITGSHGKTTTTAMIAWMLENAGLDPTVLVGGILRGWGTNARTGSSPWMVVEADESDGTFVKLPTEIGIVTNIDPEHLDYYGTEDALHAAFNTFFAQIPLQGLTVAGIDHPVVRELISKRQGGSKASELVTFGTNPDAHIRIDSIYTNGGSVTFDIIAQNADRTPLLTNCAIKLKVPGAHNAQNAAAAIAVGFHLGLPADVILQALTTFEGVDRRFTQTGAWNGVVIFDDYAHHPAEIEAALSAARGATKGDVIAVMQPHRFSRLQTLFRDFCACFYNADTVLVAPVYSAGETPNGYDRDTLVEGIRSTGHARVFPIDGEEALAKTVAALAKPGDLVIGLGAGNITEWARALPAQLTNYPAFAAAE